MTDVSKHKKNIGWPSTRRVVESKWSMKTPTDPEVNYAEKPPKGALEFWGYVLSLPSNSIIKNITWSNEYGKKCAKALNQLIKKLGMERMMVLGAYYVKNWAAIRKAYNWQHPASPVQFFMFIDKIDFCETNGIPLNPVDRVSDDASYAESPLEALKKSLEDPSK